MMPTTVWPYMGAFVLLTVGLVWLGNKSEWTEGG